MFFSSFTHFSSSFFASPFPLPFLPLSLFEDHFQTSLYSKDPTKPYTLLSLLLIVFLLQFFVPKPRLLLVPDGGERGKGRKKRGEGKRFKIKRVIFLVAEHTNSFFCYFFERNRVEGEGRRENLQNGHFCC